MNLGHTTNNERVIVIAPTSVDQELTRSVLSEADISCQICANLKELSDEFDSSVAAILLSANVLHTFDRHVLVSTLSNQPAWSDIPIILLAESGADSSIAAWCFEQLGNITILDQPVRIATMVSAVRSAIRARRRQYELRDRVRALRKSEERFRTLADNIAQFAWTASKLGQATWYNRRWYEYTGTTREEMQDRGWERVVHPDHLERVNKKISACIEQETVWEDTFPLRGANGEYRWFLSRSVPIRSDSGEIKCWFGTNTDITEQRLAEEAALESEIRMRQLLSLMPMAVYTCDSSGQITFFNRHAVEIWGREPVIGEEDEKFCGSFRLWKADGSRLLHSKTPMARAIDSGRSCRNEQVIVERPDGSRVTVSVNIDPLYDNLGNRRGAINVFEDVTERVQAVTALRDADRRKDEFLAMLAHELRNPLAPIRTGLQVIQLCGDDRETAIDTLQMMDRQLRQLVRLIDDLLDVSRITRGNIELRRERCDLSSILSVAVESSRPTIEEYGVELTVSVPRQPIELDADPARLSQIFSNLLTNAAKYNQPGGHIWLSIERRSDQVFISVRDNGIGISADMLPRVFELFMQIDDRNRRSGLGIGLSLVRSLVELHQGSVKVRSDGLGHGSEFSVELPVIDTSQRGSQSEASLTHSTSQPLRVLVVDDNQDAAKTLALMLQLMKHVVHVAHDGAQAIAAAEEFRPDVILLDLGMPGVDGYEAAKQIRRHSWGQKVTMVALTGWGQDEDRRKTRESGFDLHLVKPVDRNRLEDLFASVEKHSMPHP